MIILKWIIQILAMLTDLVLIAATIGMLVTAYFAKDLVLWIFAILLIILAYETWKSEGGFIAWHGRKKFMENWDKIAKLLKRMWCL